MKLVTSCAIALLLFAAAVMPQPQPRKTIGFSLLEDYDKGESLAEVGKDFALFRELGVTTWRGSFGWDDYEPERGRYDFAWLHRFADLAAANGITLRPYIGYTPAWAAAGGKDKDAWNDPPRRLEDWSRFVRALASAMRRHRNIASYEIYNEENVPLWWDGSVRQYADVVRRGSDAIRSAAPGVKVLLGGMVFPDAEWVEDVCGDGQNRRRIDVVPFHAYPETWTPPDVDLEHYLGANFDGGFVHMVDEACGRKPIWINETGFATVAGKTEEDQADWWARAIATFAATPRVEHVGVYEIKDLEPTKAVIGDAPNYHLGITGTDRRKKRAFETIRRLVAFFDRPFTVEQAGVRSDAGANADAYAYTFRRIDGRRLEIRWTKSAGKASRPQISELPPDK